MLINYKNPYYAFTHPYPYSHSSSMIVIQSSIFSISREIPPSPLPSPIHQTGLPSQLKELTPRPKQLLRRAELDDLAPLQDDDAVAVDDSVDSVRNGDDGAVGEEVAAQRLLQQRVRLDVDGRRRLV